MIGAVSSLKYEYQDALRTDSQDCHICLEEFNQGSRRRFVHLEIGSDKRLHPICQSCIKQLEEPVRCPSCREFIDRVSIYSSRELIQMQVVSRVQVGFQYVGPTAGKVCLFLGKNLIPFIVSKAILSNSTLSSYSNLFVVGSSCLLLLAVSVEIINLQRLHPLENSEGD